MAEYCCWLAFITFASVDQARKVINRFRHQALWPASLRADYPNLRLGPAPTPSDIRWEHLEVRDDVACVMTCGMRDDVAGARPHR